MTDADRERLVAYLLGELPPDEHHAVAAALAADPALRAESEALAPVVTRLERLPASVWESLEEAPPALDLPDAALERPRRDPAPRRLVLRPVVAVLCALALLAAGIGAGVLLTPADEAPAPVALAPPVRVALDPIGTAGASAGGRVEVAADEATLRVQGLEAAPGHFYELWLLDPDGQMVALGSFRVDARGAAEVRVPLPVDPERYRFFDVSLQPDNGDPAHSGVSVLRGRS